VEYKLSIAIPIFNEAGNLELLYKRLIPILTSLPVHNYEIIFVNDGSHDESWYIIEKLAAFDPSIKALSFSRNFGHQAALTAAYDHATGDAIISMDADLQDPPELILTLVEKWKAGNHIVYARRINRQDSLVKKLTAFGYYLFLNAVTTIKIPRNVGDFRLIDKSVLHVLHQCKEKSRYLRGMVAWAGFKYDFVDFKRPNRAQGITGYTWSKMLRLGFDGLTGFSLFPLKIAAFFGFFMILTGALMFSYVSYDALLHDTYYPLFKWLVILLYIFMGLQMLLLWLIGEYIGRIHEQQQNRPLYIVGQKINI